VQAEVQKMLLYAVAAMRVRPTANPGWFVRCDDTQASVISTSEDVLDVLLRLPQAWNVVERAYLAGVHDDTDIVEDDVRFSNGDDRSVFAIVSHDDGRRYVALLQINAVEAVLLRKCLFDRGEDIDACVD
jgi:hypothetical protein